MNIEQIRKDFPTLERKVNNKDLIYLDTAATSQTPKVVIDAINNYYNHQNSNVHRGVHTMSQEATESFELVRDKLKNFIGAKEREEIIFTKGTTESINLLAYSFSEAYIREGDEIIISELEHHSNIVPWQIIAERKKAKLRIIPYSDEKGLDIEKFSQMLNPNTKIVSVSHVSNALGVVNPIEKIIEIAHTHNVPVHIDGAQGAPHFKLNMQELDCDFYSFSAHKLYGPMGAGILYGKRKYLEAMPPFHGGGEMIKEVSFSGTTYNEIPFKFEAGTPSVADIIGFGAAIDYIQSIGLEKIQVYEHKIMQYAIEKLSSIEDLFIYGNQLEKSGSLSFNIDGIHSFDLGTLLDQLGIAVRTGHHCAQPIMQHYYISGTIRASFGIYTTLDEIDTLYSSIIRLKSMLK